MNFWNYEKELANRKIMLVDVQTHEKPEQIVYDNQKEPLEDQIEEDEQKPPTIQAFGETKEYIEKTILELTKIKVNVEWLGEKSHILKQQPFQSVEVISSTILLIKWYASMADRRSHVQTEETEDTIRITLYEELYQGNKTIDAVECEALIILEEPLLDKEIRDMTPLTEETEIKANGYPRMVHRR